jgi:hypothetical protein
MGSPDDVDVALRDRWVRRDDRDSLDLRLSNQEAMEWIAMDGRQPTGAKRMGQLDR